MLEVVQIQVLNDNYVYLLAEPESGVVAVVDPAEAKVVEQALEQRGWALNYILNTHHHHDHVGGNLALKRRFGCQIIGSGSDRHRIPGIDRCVCEGDVVRLGRASAVVMETPGHTIGHIVYYFEADKALFCGDTLFSLGCGRLFEGSSQQMWHSLERLRELDDQTLVYCAHEYTESNARFAVGVDPLNKDLLSYTQEVQKRRQRGEPTIPCCLGREKRCNPFLRADSSTLSSSAAPREPVDVFAEMRQAKDEFRG